MNSYLAGNRELCQSLFMDELEAFVTGLELGERSARAVDKTDGEDEADRSMRGPRGCGHRS